MGMNFLNHTDCKVLCYTVVNYICFKGGIDVSGWLAVAIWLVLGLVQDNAELLFMGIGGLLILLLNTTRYKLQEMARALLGKE